MISEPKNDARILLWDIETSNLDADFGRIFCIGYKWYDESTVHCPSIVLPEQGKSWDNAEHELIETFMQVYETADISVTYNGILFDLPYINTKYMRYHSSGAPAPVAQTDLYWTVKSKTRLSRKSLQNLSYYLGGEYQKSGVEPRLWLAAREGNKAALRAIIQHCKIDVLALEEDYTRLRPFITKHPRVNGYGPCRYCGGRIILRGPSMSKYKYPRHRVQCTNPKCYGWDTRTDKELGLK